MHGQKLRKFNRICNELADFIREAHEENEDIEIFVSGEGYTSINLIDKKGEDDDYWRSHQDECIISSVDIPYTDCGGI